MGYKAQMPAVATLTEPLFGMWMKPALAIPRFAPYTPTGYI